MTEVPAGTVTLFGEPRTDLVRARQRIGYVAQEQTFYGWMTPSQLGTFVGAFYPTWDGAELRRLAQRLEVPVRQLAVPRNSVVDDGPVQRREHLDGAGEVLRDERRLQARDVVVAHAHEAALGQPQRAPHGVA